MILYEILGLLGNSPPLIAKLGITEDDPKIYPYGTEVVQDCIVYTFTPLASDGVKEQSRLELNIITQSEEDGLEILEIVKDVLLTIGDNKKTNKILEISLNGGGTMENIETGTVHHKAYFLVKNRR